MVKASRKQFPDDWDCWGVATRSRAVIVIIRSWLGELLYSQSAAMKSSFKEVGTEWTLVTWTCLALQQVSLSIVFPWKSTLDPVWCSLPVIIAKQDSSRKWVDSGRRLFIDLQVQSTVPETVTRPKLLLTSPQAAFVTKFEGRRKHGPYRIISRTGRKHASPPWTLSPLIRAHR